MKAFEVVFLVRGVDGVVVFPESDQHRCGIQNFLEMPRNGNRSATADIGGGNVPFIGQNVASQSSGIMSVTILRKLSRMT